MTNFLDLDAVAEETKYSFKLDGVTHELKITTVDDFIENTRLIESLGTSATMDDEIKVIVKILCRLLPSLNEERLRKLTLPQLRKLNEWARGAGGEKTETAPAAEAPSEGNVQAS